MRSTVCRYEHFTSDWYLTQSKALLFNQAVDDPTLSHRKNWEWAAITQALEDADMLRPDRKGLGFAVGTELLPSIFASRGAKILATDRAEPGHWAETGQHGTGLDPLFQPSVLSRRDFRARVQFQHVDMNEIQDLPSDAFDFLWSSCAIEHVGSLELAMNFVKNAMRLLRRGGIAVHTTEFNCSSTTDTVEEGDNVIFRRRDIERLAAELRLMRCGMQEPDFECGVHPFDLDYDEPPFFSSERMHIKLLIDGFVATSFLMVIHKG